MSIKAFGIFEGGGAKGFAHVGALKASKERQIQFVGVSGTSAGAIVAALVAAGHDADSLFDLEYYSGAMSEDFSKFFDPKKWATLRSFESEIGDTDGLASTELKLAWIVGIVALIAGVLFSVFGWLGFYFSYGYTAFALLVVTLSFWGMFKKWLLIHWMLFKYRSMLAAIAKDGGYLSTDNFRGWLETQLLEKLREVKPGFEPTGSEGKVAFRDLAIPLKIIAADVSKRQIRLFPKNNVEDDNFSVSEAVAASISIPFALHPKQIQDRFLVDGGIMSNFPVWVFDNERKEHPPHTPTLGFKLVEERQSKKIGGYTLWSHLGNVANSAAFGDNALETRNVSTFYEIPLKVRIGMLDFDISNAEKENVFNRAERQTEKYFSQNVKVWKKSEKQIEEALIAFEHGVRGLINHQGHLRFNVMWPNDENQLQIVYSHNMNGDPDSGLIFSRGEGACGKCWEELDGVVCDLTDVDHWRLIQEKQAVVRTGLQSLFSIPLFHPRFLANDDVESRENAFFGVLNVDSDEQLTEKFKDLRKVDGLKAITAMVAQSFTT